MALFFSLSFIDVAHCIIGSIFGFDKNGTKIRRLTPLLFQPVEDKSSRCTNRLRKTTTSPKPFFQNHTPSLNPNSPLSQKTLNLTLKKSLFEKWTLRSGTLPIPTNQPCAICYVHSKKKLIFPLLNL